jgi:ubiquinone/menaquinone biosynthesis C-methylase UbiE
MAMTAIAGLAAVAGGLWYRRYTTPFPYAQRWMLDKELAHLTRDRLCSLLDPQSGERILEIGPGTGLFSLPVARRLAPGGRLEVFDIQQVMLDHTLARARAAGITNISATCGDARRLPYPDAHFHAAYLMTALGEIGDQDQALAELRRVLRPDGRLVVGEFLVDWHAVRLGALTRRAARHGLEHERRLGPRYSYLARFVPAPERR